MRRVLLWLAIGMLGAASPAAADNFSIWNCTAQTIEFKLYNQGDGPVLDSEIYFHSFQVRLVGSVPM